MVLVASMMVANAPSVFAQDGGCQSGQDQAWINAWIKHDNDKQTLKHLEKLIDCTLDQPPGEGQ
jgi:hypothetical protein